MKKSPRFIFEISTVGWIIIYLFIAALLLRWRDKRKGMHLKCMKCSHQWDFKAKSWKELLFAKKCPKCRSRLVRRALFKKNSKLVSKSKALWSKWKRVLPTFTIILLTIALITNAVLANQAENELLTEISDLEFIISDLNEDLRSAEASYTSLNEKYLELEKKGFQAVKETEAEAKTDLEAAEKEYTLLLSQYESLRTKHNNLVMDYNDLRKDYNRLVDDYNNLLNFLRGI